MATNHSGSPSSHTQKQRAFRRNSDCLRKCFKCGTEDKAFALYARGLISEDARSGSAADIVNNLESKLGYDEDVWEKMLVVLRDEGESHVVKMLQTTLEDELAPFVANGRSPTLRSVSADCFSSRHWIQPTYRSAFGDSSQQLCSGNTGVRIREQFSTFANSDSAVVLETGFSGQTQQHELVEQSDFYSQEATEETSSPLTLAPTPTVHESNVSAMRHSMEVSFLSLSDRKHVGTGISRRQVTVPPFSPSDTQQQIHAQASEDIGHHSTQATSPTSDSQHSEIVSGLSVVTQTSVQRSLEQKSVIFSEEKKENLYFQQQLTDVLQKVERLTIQKAEQKDEVERLREDKGEICAAFKKEMTHSMYCHDEMSRNRKYICQLLDKIEKLEKDKGKLKQHMEAKEKELLEKQKELSEKSTKIEMAERMIAILQTQIEELRLNSFACQQEIEYFKEKVKSKLLKAEQERNKWRRQSITTNRELLDLKAHFAFKIPFVTKRHHSL